MILRVWLKIVPDYTVAFVRLMLGITIIDAMAGSLMVAAQATGRIRFYQSMVGGVLLFIVPISYIVLRLGAAPWSVFVVHFCICIFAFIIRLLIIRSMIHLSLYRYFHQVVLRCLWVLLLATPLPIVLFYVLPNTFVVNIFICVICVFMMLLFSYFVGLTVNEKVYFEKKYFFKESV